MKIRRVGLWPDPKLPPAIQDAIVRLWNLDIEGAERCVCGPIDTVNSETPPIFQRMHMECPVYAGFYALLAEHEVDRDTLELTELEVDVDPDFIKGSYMVDSDEDIEELQNRLGFTSEVGKDWYKGVVRKPRSHWDPPE